MRLCPEDVSDALSGFGHNGVSPVGLATPLPIVLSHRIARLEPDFFFCGAILPARGAPGRGPSCSLSTALIPLTRLMCSRPRVFDGAPAF